MRTIHRIRRVLAGWLVACALGHAHTVRAQIPDRPIITEVFNNPTGNDGPTGRLPGNAHQEFVELYVPDAANLRPGLNRDGLQLTFYEIEGDFSSLKKGSVNERVDLPPIDADPSNGLTPGAIARPARGVIVLGWVDYNSVDPPTDLAGTMATRLGLVNGGVTTPPPGSLFIPVNGKQFGGTTNFAVPQAESFVDVPNENATGVFRNGSNVYLLVDRDDPGYASLADLRHPELGPSDAALRFGTVLGLSSLLDGFAGNDDPNFNVARQPIPAPTGLGIDLEDLLPVGGAFSRWIAQVPEGSGGGYARTFLDAPKTTEDGIPGNEDPAADAAGRYRVVFRSGPFFPAPGRVIFMSSPPELGVSRISRLSFEVLAGTTGRPGLISANVGGDFPIDITATPGPSTDPSVASFAASSVAMDVAGQSFAFPRIAVSVPMGAPNGAIVTAPVSFSATNARGGDPAVLNPSDRSSVQATVLRPLTGVNQSGFPHQATVFAALQGFGVDPATANEFAPSDLGRFTAAGLGHTVLVASGHGDTLVSPSTDLELLDTVGPLRRVFPVSETDFISAAGALGTPDLVGTVTTSPKFIVSPTTYSAGINAARTGVRAYSVDLPETVTHDGTFSPTENIFFVDALGGEFDERSGLSFVTTDRTFELALIDTNVTSTGIEAGGADDFGLIVRVGRTRQGARVAPGELVFLSYTGGLGGEDIDGVEIPGSNATVAILLDLDNLDTVLGCETITELFVIDASGSGTVNVIETISLNPRCATLGNCPFFGDGNRDGLINLDDLPVLNDCMAGPGLVPGAAVCSMFDFNQDGDTDLRDYGSFQRRAQGP